MVREKSAPKSADDGATVKLPALFRMKRRTDRKRLFRRSDCLLNVLSSMRRAQKRSLELRRRKINAIVEHRPEKTAEGLRMGCRGGIPVRKRTGGEEPGEHGPSAAGATAQARIVSRCHQTHHLVSTRRT